MEIINKAKRKASRCVIIGLLFVDYSLEKYQKLICETKLFSSICIGSVIWYRTGRSI